MGDDPFKFVALTSTGSEGDARSKNLRSSWKIGKLLCNHLSKHKFQKSVADKSFVCFKFSLQRLCMIQVGGDIRETLSRQNKSVRSAFEAVNSNVFPCAETWFLLSSLNHITSLS